MFVGHDHDNDHYIKYSKINPLTNHNITIYLHYGRRTSGYSSHPKMNEDGGKIIILHSSNHSLSTYIRDVNGNIEYQLLNKKVNESRSDALCFNKYLYEGIPWPRDNIYKKKAENRNDEKRMSFIYLLLIPIIPVIVYLIFPLRNYISKYFNIMKIESKGFRRIKESF